MSRALIAVVFSAFVVLALPARANEKPTDAYQKAMRENGAALQAMRAASKEIEESGAGSQDYQPFETATATMKGSFATTLAFWQAQKVDDAVKQSQIAIKAVAEIEAAAKDRDYRQLLESFTALGETCTACHMAHRVRLPDGAFEIK
jgi:cytochrome c556